MTMTISVTTEQWTKRHELHLFRQAEQRPSSAGWTECQGTGLVHLVCNCGYSSGWIASDDMPSVEQLMADHGKAFRSIVAGF
ncbi:hypothetical protein [Streptomyces synnematoformans]|uniref:Uncharacterized protein n=1 Tax=Streptomyces synnematoformans TaxID=415721 RepID=A0ABN2XES6_9ACTN